MAEHDEPAFSGPTETRPSTYTNDADTNMEAGPSRVRLPQSPASPESAFATTRQPSPPEPSTPHLDLASYPTPTLLRLLANLLQQIATANDQLRPNDIEDTDEESHPDDTSHSSRGESNTRGNQAQPQPHPSPTTALFSIESDPTSTSAESHPHHLFTASKTSLAHPASLLSFHARHIPAISIKAYLLRILKYCPTTNEVFLGLLVYFDRMSRLGTPAGVGGVSAGAMKGVGRGFAIDSYNVHRLVIAGVTVASKFFSGESFALLFAFVAERVDVFYTNSRYAKVGGLPSHELNQLELQFLLLNDFLLVIPPDEMQRYGDRLLSYWEGREAEVGVEAVVLPPTPIAQATTTPTASATTQKDETPTPSQRPIPPAQSTKSSMPEPAVTQPHPASTPARSTSEPHHPPHPHPHSQPSPHPPPTTTVAPKGRERDRTSVVSFGNTKGRTDGLLRA